MISIPVNTVSHKSFRTPYNLEKLLNKNHFKCKKIILYESNKNISYKKQKIIN